MYHGKIAHRVLALTLILSFVLASGCQPMPAATPTVIPPTATIAPTPTATATPIPSATPVPTNTPVPTVLPSQQTFGSWLASIKWTDSPANLPVPASPCLAMKDAESAKIDFGWVVIIDNRGYQKGGHDFLIFPGPSMWAVGGCYAFTMGVKGGTDPDAAPEFQTIPQGVIWGWDGTHMWFVKGAVVTVGGGETRQLLFEQLTELGFPITSISLP